MTEDVGSATVASPVEADQLAELLGSAIKGSYEGFDARFRSITGSDEQVKGTFVYPSFGAQGQPVIDRLAEWLYYRIIAFCIPQAERDRANADYARTQDDRYKMEIQDKACTLFVRARESQKTSGEPGELLLFTLLEAVLKAPQIASKMYLKTSVNVAVHGSDSIHAMVGDTATNLRLVWGESKTHKGLDSAIDRICTSLEAFFGTNGDISPRERDISIIKDHLNVTDPVLRQEVLAFLDPYNEQSNSLEEMVACLVAYESPIYRELESMEKNAREQQFRERYKDSVDAACKRFTDGLQKANLSTINTHLFLLPVPNLLEFRKAFFRKLRYTQEEILAITDE